MQFAASGVCSVDVGDSIRMMHNQFGDALREELGRHSFASPVKLIVFHPILMAPEMNANIPDRVAYSRGEPAVQFNSNISHSAWVQGDRTERVNLYAEALARGVRQIKDQKLSAVDKTAFLKAVETVRRNMTTS